MPISFYVLLPLALAAALLVYSLIMTRHTQRSDTPLYRVPGRPPPRTPTRLQKLGSNLALALIGAGAVMLALLGLWRFGAEWTLLLESQRWESVPGLVIEAGLEEITGQDTPARFFPHVVYEYTVGDQGYRSSRLLIGEPRPVDRASAYQTINRYRPGQTVNVHVDPANPEQAVLERRLDGGLALVIGMIPLLFLGSTLLGIVLGRLSAPLD